MKPDLSHLTETFREILSGLIPPRAYARREALDDVPSHWVGQVEGMLGDVALPVMARDGDYRRWNDTNYLAEVHVRSLSGAGCLVRVKLDLKACDAPDPLLVWVEGHGGEALPLADADTLREVMAGGKPVASPDTWLASALHVAHTDIPFRAAGDGVVQIGIPRNPGTRDVDFAKLARILRMADAAGATLAYRTERAIASDLAKFGFEPGMRWATRPGREGAIVGLAPVKMPLFSGDPAKAPFVPVLEVVEPVRAAEPRTAPARTVQPSKPATPPSPPAVAKAPTQAAPPAPPMPAFAEVEKALAVVRANMGRHARTLEGVIAETALVASAGGTGHREAASLRNLANKHANLAWADLLPIPLGRTRGNELARALLHGLPNVAMSKGTQDAQTYLKAAISELPLDSTTTALAKRGLAFLEACTVVMAVAERAVLRPTARKAPAWLEPTVGSTSPWQVMSHAHDLMAAVRTARQGEGKDDRKEQFRLALDTTVGDLVTWTLASVPGTKVVAMRTSEDEHFGATLRIDLVNGKTALAIEGRQDLRDGSVTALAWYEGPKGKVRYNEGDDLRRPMGMKGIAADAPSLALAKALREGGGYPDLIAIPEARHTVFLETRRHQGNLNLDIRGLTALADEHEVALHMTRSVGWEMRNAITALGFEETSTKEGERLVRSPREPRAPLAPGMR